MNEDFRKLTPAEVAEKLRSGEIPAPDDNAPGTSNQSCGLCYENGLFKLTWSATGLSFSCWDWVGLFKKRTDTKEVAYQWACYGWSYMTKYKPLPGYQARYYIWDTSTRVYRCVAQTETYPDISLMMQTASGSTASVAHIGMSLRIYDEIKFLIKYDPGFFNQDDWIGIYKSSDLAYDKYDAYVNLSDTSSQYQTGVNINPGYELRYYTKIAGNWSLQAKTAGFPGKEAFSPRAPTALEKANLVFNFPLLKDSNKLRITGLSDPVYNCIAYTFGFRDRWINPPYLRTDFNTLFKNYGLDTCIGANTADGWEATNAETKITACTHGSTIFTGDGVSQAWESKLGPSYRITHAENELNSTAYGSVFQHYKLLGSNSVNPDNLKSFAAVADKHSASIVEKAVAVPSETKQQFYTLYDEWKAAIAEKMQFVSDTKKYAELPEFEKLVKLGEAVVPLVVEKLRGINDFPAVVLMEALMPKEALYAENDINTVLSEQEKALSIIERLY
jgi:hypothetical protein